MQRYAMTNGSNFALHLLRVWDDYQVHLRRHYNHREVIEKSNLWDFMDWIREEMREL